MGLYNQEAKKATEYALTEAENIALFQRSHWWMINSMRNDGGCLTGLGLACRFKNGLEEQLMLAALGVLVLKWLGRSGLAGLISLVGPMGTGKYGWINGWGLATRTGVLPLDLEGRQAAGSGGCHQLRQCCKGTEYFCQSKKKYKYAAHISELTHSTR